MIGLALAALYARRRIRGSRAVAAQVPALVELVLERLATQRRLGDGGGEEGADDPWLFLPNLRDDVLRSVHSLGARERIWRRVRAVVEQNSNVRAGQRESRATGEVGRAWEWIGPLGAGDVDGYGSGSGAAARRRKSGRASWVKREDGEGERKAKTTTGERGGSPELGSDKNKLLHRRWEEPRPIY